MPLYDLRCKECGTTEEVFSPISVGVPQSNPCACGGTLRRVWNPPAVKGGWVDHFNPSVGQYVSSRREFADLLARGADEQSRVTGLDHRYAVVDAAELPPAPGAEEALEPRRRLARDEGWTEDPGRTIVT